VIPNVVDLDKIRDLANGAPPDLPDGRYVLFFGRLEPLKGVHFLAHAMKKIFKLHPDVYLVLAGLDCRWKGRLMTEHINDAVGDDASRVLYLGELHPKMLMPLIRVSDVVALPSQFEAFGFTVLETMALGRPLVTTNGHGPDDFVEDGREGLMVPRGDAPSLTAAVDRLLSDRELAAELGARASRRADEYGLGPGARRASEILAEVIPLISRSHSSTVMYPRSPTTTLGQ
jgi:glycosyltransferase involved in cell wall biosynthesis